MITKYQVRTLRSMVAAIAVLILWTLGTPSAAEAHHCTPSANQVALFQLVNYGHACVVKDVGDYRNAEAIGLPDNSISSLKVGSRVWAVLCPDTNIGGDCKTFHENDSDLRDNGNGNNTVSSVQVKALCPPGADEIALFALPNYTGACEVVGVGADRYSAFGLSQDTVSSIQVGANVRALLCSNRLFEGRCEVFTTNDPNLADNSIGDNTVSSVLVYGSCAVNADQVALYRNSDYEGPCVVKGVGKYANNLALGLANESISSIKVGANVGLMACVDEDFGGACSSVTSNGATTSSFRTGHTISSIWVYRRCVPRSHEIALYLDEDFNGPCVVKGIGQYTYMGDIGLPFDSISSIKTGGDVEALVCRDQIFEGRCSVIRDDPGELRGSWIGDNTISSVSVQRRNRTDCVPNRNQASLWEFPYYFGRCAVTDIGVYPYVHGADITPYLSSTRAIKVGANVNGLYCPSPYFEGTCTNLTNDDRYLASELRSLYIRREGQPPDCVPNANQVALYRYPYFIGRCMVKDIGEHDLDNNPLGNSINSLKVGANVQARLCWQTNSGNRCQTFTADAARDVSRSDQEIYPSLSVRRREQTSPNPPDPAERTRTVWLEPHVPFTGFPWWTGRFPTIGSSDGTLTGIENPRNSVWLGFLKPGYGSVDCGNSDAYVLLRPGDTMTGDQMQTVFGSRTPTLPVSFLACSGDVADQGAGGVLRFHSLPITIRYTED